MKALKDLFASERGLIVLMLLVGVTAGMFTGHVGFPEWKEYTLYIFGIYVVGKSATGIATIMRGNSTEDLGALAEQLKDPKMGDAIGAFMAAIDKTAKSIIETKVPLSKADVVLIPKPPEQPPKDQPHIVPDYPAPPKIGA